LQAAAAVAAEAEAGETALVVMVVDL